MFKGFSFFTDIQLWELQGHPVTLQHVLIAAAILIVSVVTARLMRGMIARARRRRGVTPNASLYLAERLGFYLIVFVGLVAALSAIGLNLTSLSIFAGALGVGIGLAMQDIVKNFMSGIVLLMDRSIEVGDFIELDNGVAGEVRSVGARATMIVTNDNVDILIPNAKLQDSNLTNWTRERVTRRIHVPFSVAYGSSKEKVREAALEAARAVPFTLADEGDRRTQVWLTGFGDSSLDFELVVWPSLEAVKRPGAMMAAYAWALEDALRRHGIEIPFPQRDLHVRTLFGKQGEAAFAALAGDRSRAVSPEPAALAPSPNDAAQDLIAGARSNAAGSSSEDRSD